MVNVSIHDLRPGCVFNTNSGPSVTVVKIISYKNIVVKFNDDTGYQTEVNLNNLNAGRVKNPYHPNVYGMGYIGEGQYRARVNVQRTPEYGAWYLMLQRCYDPVFHSRQPTYIGVTVCPEWLNFQNFAYWYCNQPQYNWNFELDKDVLYPGNRIYSPMTSCLIPKEINNAFHQFQGYTPCHGKFMARINDNYLGIYDTPEEALNIYLVAKQSYLYELVNKWQYCISEEVQNAILDAADNLLCAG